MGEYRWDICLPGWVGHVELEEIGREIAFSGITTLPTFVRALIPL